MNAAPTPNPGSRPTARLPASSTGSRPAHRPMTTPIPAPCLVPGCGGTAEAPELIALCPDHLALAAEVHGVGHGVTAPMPEPCRLCGSRLGARHPTGWTCAVCEWPHGEHPD